MFKVSSAFISAILLCVFSINAAQAQSIEDQFNQKTFLIIGSTKSFDAAKQIAQEASGKLSLEYDEDLVYYEPTDGLTFSKETCDSAEFEYPCYVARGRYDDGVYISVEYSNSYDGFTEGYYVVMAASGDKNSKEIKEGYKRIREVYPDCYLKKSNVYMGCMH